MLSFLWLFNRSFYWFFITQLSLVIMAGPIKLFQSVQNSYQSVGIYLHHSNQFFTFHPKKYIIVLGLITSFTSRLGYFVFEAKFVEENGFKSLYQCFSVLIASVDFLLSISFMPVNLELIEMFNEFIEKSKSTICAFKLQKDDCSVHSQW